MLVETALFVFAGRWETSLEPHPQKENEKREEKCAFKFVGGVWGLGTRLVGNSETTCGRTCSP